MQWYTSIGRSLRNAISFPLALVVAALALTPVAAGAAVVDWSGTAAATDWGTGTNWVGDAAPANDLTTDIARFAQTSFVNQPDAGTTSVNGIRLGDGTTTAAAMTISGTALSIGSGGVTMFANTAASTINAPVIVAANQTWTNNATTNVLTINGNVTGNAGTGDTTTLSAACTGTGGMFFDAAILGDGTLGGKLALAFTARAPAASRSVAPTRTAARRPSVAAN